MPEKSIDGTSGTGKTSSTILPAIRDDLNMRCKAEDKQKEQLQAFLENGEISYAPPKGACGFSINDCIPIVPDARQLSDTEVEQRIAAIQEKLEHLRLAYPVCGITVLAPDDSLTDDVCRLCDARDIPHFFYVDELPVLIHPSLEKNFSLFRKFRVSMMVAIQTLDQMEKNEITKYLKGVILGCAHIIVFGRSSLSDMEIFSSLASIRDVKEVQTSTTETALTDNSPHFSYSSREMVTQRNVIEEIGIRMKDFQEVTFFTTRAGRPLPTLSRIVDFLKPFDWERKKRLPFSIEREEDSLEGQKTPPITIPNDGKVPENGYRFLPGTPLSIFYSSAHIDTTGKDDTKNIPPKPDQEKDTGLPEGSERIDDIL